MTELPAGDPTVFRRHADTGDISTHDRDTYRRAEPFMYSLVYASSATVDFTSTDLEALLSICRRNNALHHVTGMLIYKDGNFMQLLEGQREVVTQLFDKIMMDPRHRGTLQLLSTEGSERMFPDWSMAFRDLRSPTVIKQPGFSDFLDPGQPTQAYFANPTWAQKLLIHFKQNMR